VGQDRRAACTTGERHGQLVAVVDEVFRRRRGRSRAVRVVRPPRPPAVGVVAVVDRAARLAERDVAEAALGSEAALAVVVVKDWMGRTA
jgi:hypothetical protein